MKKLKIKRMSKNKNNIAYQFNAMIGFVQEVVKINDEESYNNSYIITYKEQIDESWYYIETK